jgi:uncharacterized protein YutE (UPF0331/DUF86 family)
MVAEPENRGTDDEHTNSSPLTRPLDGYVRARRRDGDHALVRNELLAPQVSTPEHEAAGPALDANPDGFEENHSAQDAAILNAIRACETAIDLANMLIRKRRLGIPSETRESFTILVQEKLLAKDLGERLHRMVGFRNLAVHQYRELDIGIVETVIRDRLDDLLAFAEAVRPLLDEGAT